MNFVFSNYSLGGEERFYFFFHFHNLEAVKKLSLETCPKCCGWTLVERKWIRGCAGIEDRAMAANTMFILFLCPWGGERQAGNGLAGREEGNS